MNLPLEAGGTDADFELVYNTVALPVLRQFRPELILISAGFDALDDDPLAGMRLERERVCPVDRWHCRDVPTVLQWPRRRCHGGWL